MVLLSCCEAGTNVTSRLGLENNYQQFLFNLICGLRRDSHSAALRPLFNVLINNLPIEIEYTLIKYIVALKPEWGRIGLLTNLHKLEKYSARHM